MKTFLITVLFFTSISLTAQTTIHGTVKDDTGKPLIGANIYLKGTYTGATSDTSGFFRFNTSMKDTGMLVVGYIGYETVEIPLMLNKSIITINIKLKESSSSLDQVVITAGTFEAGDKKRSVLLSSLDIVTTANAEGDIYGALNMLPGAQTEGETGKIIVRGGESHEMKTFMDGMLISSPYTSRMPDIPARGRFSPFLFNGVLFSTGGYSAEYGQALSSVLELNTEGVADESLSSISLLSVGVGLSHTQRFTNSSLTVETNYNNLTPYFAMIKSDLDWQKVPESLSGQVRFRKKVGKEGMIKSFLTCSGSKSALNYPNYSTNTIDRIGLQDKNLFQSTTFNTPLGDKWIIKSGLAVNLTQETYNINQTRLTDDLNSGHTRVSLNNYFSKNITLKFGVETFVLENQKKYSDFTLSENYIRSYTDFLFAGFAEADVRLSKNIAFRVGERTEYSSYLQRFDAAPRLSLAYQFYKRNQFSIAYGRFYQEPDNDFQVYTDSLNYENATHYILNYQYAENNQIFRIEAYQKQYHHLINYVSSGNSDYAEIDNNGFGYARGIDVFWRDKQTFKMADYWISYSFLDTKRMYRDYPIEATPDYVSKHNLSIVFKYWYSKISTQLSLSYKYRSGRPYFNPNTTGFLTNRTRPFNDLSLAASHLTNLFGNFTIIYVSCTNVMGFRNVFGYHYESQPDGSGVYQAHAIQPYSRRTFIIGIFISIK